MTTGIFPERLQAAVMIISLVVPLVFGRYYYWSSRSESQFQSRPITRSFGFPSFSNMCSFRKRSDVLRLLPNRFMSENDLLKMVPNFDMVDTKPHNPTYKPVRRIIVGSFIGRAPWKSGKVSYINDNKCGCCLTNEDAPCGGGGVARCKQVTRAHWSLVWTQSVGVQLVSHEVPNHCQCVNVGSASPANSSVRTIGVKRKKRDSG
ncbi:uncharacterized protein LOC121380605 isoform X3 [Gigantopelta aegis]|uniref:uncharacterized protein LOC121380605 isoform X3 n=1 Tax=Gigantopelta aegis TaxID=1735272 RepID=UPI001B88BE38|nr:uncharacterized protein LOC121380605 isoform X3 [Gigantopelta aegis]